MNYFYVYLGIGFFILCGVLIQSFSKRDKDFSDWSALTNQLRFSQQSYLEKFFEKILLPLLTAILVVVAWPLAIIFAFNYFRAKKEDDAVYDFSEPKKFTVKPENLIRQMTIEEIEKLENINDPENAAPAKPFGHFYALWRNFVESILPSDEVWSFDADWGEFASVTEKRAGYALLRQGYVVAQFIKGIKKIN